MVTPPQRSLYGSDWLPSVCLNLPLPRATTPCNPPPTPHRPCLGSSGQNCLKQKGGGLGKERGLVGGRGVEGALSRSPVRLPKCSVINK